MLTLKNTHSQEWNCNFMRRSWILVSFRGFWNRWNSPYEHLQMHCLSWPYTSCCIAASLQRAKSQTPLEPSATKYWKIKYSVIDQILEQHHWTQLSPHHDVLSKSPTFDSQTGNWYDHPLATHLKSLAISSRSGAGLLLHHLYHSLYEALPLRMTKFQIEDFCYFTNNVSN